MAKERMVNTRFWNDTFISGLDPIEKLLFVYLLTNEHTNISGIYELPLKVAALETGIDESMFKKIFVRLKPKVVYISGWVCMINFPKYQSLSNPKIQIAIKRELDLISSDIIKKAIAYGYPMDRLSHFNLNFNLNSNLTDTENSEEVPAVSSTDETVKKKGFNPLGANVLKAFEEIDPKNKTYYGNKTQRSACDFLLSEYGLEKVMSRIEQIKTHRGVSFFPVILSPHDLKEKGEAFRQALIKENKKQNHE